VVSVFAAFSFSDAIEAFHYLFPRMYAHLIALFMLSDLFSIGFFFWPFDLWLLRLLFSHWQLGLLEVVDQGDAQ
jgi:hypothetical protein